MQDAKEMPESLVETQPGLSEVSAKRVADRRNADLHPEKFVVAKLSEVLASGSKGTATSKTPSKTQQ